MTNVALTVPPSMRGVTQRLEDGRVVLRVADPHALVQVIGWLKFIHRGSLVIYRGQVRRHAQMAASGVRDVKSPGRQRLAHQLRDYIDELSGGPCTCPEGPYTFGQAHRCIERIPRRAKQQTFLAEGTYRAAAEPLLQHYGLRTRWLDVVDNVWVALWFACHRQVSQGSYAYHQRRSPAQEAPDESFAHIAVISTGPLRPTGIPGYLLGAQVRMVDLRYAVPSVYLRPHAQHGLLVAPGTMPDNSTGSMSDQVVATLEIHLRDALDWLGTGVMTTSFVLFPPAVRDEGYRRLLLHPPRASATIGDIVTYGPGH